MTPVSERTLAPAGTRRARALPGWALQAAVVGIDCVLVTLALFSATAIRLPPSMIDADLLPMQALLVSAIMVAGIASRGGYEFQRVRNGQDVLMRIVLGMAVGFGLVVLASYVVPQVALGRGVFVLTASLLFPLLLVWRRILFVTLRESALRPRAVVMGDGPVARRVAEALSSARYGGAEVVGLLTPGRKVLSTDAEEDGPALLGTYARLREVVRQHGVTHAIVIGGSRDAALPFDEIVSLRREGLAVEEGAIAYEEVTGRILIEKLTPGWLMFANALERTEGQLAIRRVVGAVVAAFILFLIAPLLGAVALAVRLESAGPIIFRQKRVGERGRLFDVLKFRTMRQDAEAKTGAVWAKENDPRVTRLGRFMRSTRLDELPQLWNVLRGDMFFVGPRPERPEFVDMLRKEIPYYDQRHIVKPGITGWAQINYRYGASVEDAAAKQQYDLYYIQNMSFLLDLHIVLGTVQVMLGAGNKS